MYKFFLRIKKLYTYIQSDNVFDETSSTADFHRRFKAGR